jgi:acetyl esterase/lipase
MGHSAGAHLVALLSAAPAPAYAAGAAPWLGSVLLDSAALDVAQIMTDRHLRLYDQAFGKDPAYWRQVSPLQQLDASGPPMLAVCSTARRDHPCDAARSFSARATALGRRAAVLEQNHSHGEINALLGQEPAYTEAVEAFMGSLDADVAKALAGR